MGDENLELDLEPLYEDEGPGTFGAVPTSLDLKNFNEYLPDIGHLLEKEKKLYKRETIFQKTKSQPLPEPIDFDSADPTDLSMSKSQKRKQKEKQKNKKPLKDWYDLATPEITEQLENDLKALHMRSALTPKQFYKKNESHIYPNILPLQRFKIQSPIVTLILIKKKRNSLSYKNCWQTNKSSATRKSVSWL